jgi:predicted nucleic-acid-binding protein
MLAIDTNIIVRLLTKDDAVQAEKARNLLAENDVFIATTVLLETEWVLRAAYGLAKAEILAGLRAFAGLPRVTLEDAVRAEKALTWAAAGMDFADALHLAAADGCEAFVTFDRRMVTVAAGIENIAVLEP